MFFNLKKKPAPPSYAEVNSFLRSLGEGRASRDDIHAMAVRLTLGAAEVILFQRASQGDVASACAITRLLLPSAVVDVENEYGKLTAILWKWTHAAEPKKWQSKSRRTVAMNILDVTLQAWTAKALR